MARPFRYTFILILFALGTCLAAVSGWRYARASAPVNGPIVLISVDSLRADHLPAYGYREIKTPAIDSLAADGVIFERALAHVPQTLPAHVAMLTGRLPFETGVRDSVGFAVPAGERLLSEMLRDRGYSTGGIVSSFLLRQETGLDQGFSFFDGDMPADSEPLAHLRRSGSESERVAERWLDSVGTTRAFLFLHLSDADGTRTREAQSDAYDAGVIKTDDAIGRLLKYLKAHQLYDQSTVILVADHGEGLGDHGEQGHGLFVYDSTLHVPLIIKLPAGAAAGRRIKSLVQHVDLVPTVLDLAKAPVPGNLRGRSLMPLIERDTAKSDEPVYSESLYARYHFGWSELVTVTDGRYRYVSAPHEELYDLERDPAETENLADSKPDVVAAFRKTLKAIATSPASIATVTVSAEDRERYEALGYVGVVSQPAPPTTEPTDPKDKRDFVTQYREALSLAVLGTAPAALGAIDQLRTLAHREPGMRDVWLHLAVAATRGDRPEIALDAFNHAAALAPEDPWASLAAASTSIGLRRLEDAQRLAEAVADSLSADAPARAAAHEVLARVALAKRDLAGARVEAQAAEEADAGRPVVAYVEGRIRFDQRQYNDALSWFDTALARLESTPTRPLADLRLYAAEAMLRVDRFDEAEYLLQEELTDAPHSARARAGLATLYRATGRASDAAALAQH